MVRKAMFILSAYMFLLFGNSADATNYYLSNNGNDDHLGKSKDKAWKTIAKLNGIKLRPGDTVFFHSGHIFSGSILLNNSGKDKKPIVFSSYNGEDYPVIAGTISITGFKKAKDNIYVTSVSEDVKNLYLKNQRLTLARYPNSGFLTMQGGDTQYLIYDELPFSKEVLTNATARMRTVNWQYENRKIESVADYKLQFDSALFKRSDGRRFTCKNGWGYYLDNKKEFIDQNYEWFYDATEKKLYLQSNQQLSNDFSVDAAFINNGLRINKQIEYITIENLHFSKFNKFGINMLGQNKNILISNCKFTHIYLCAVRGELHSSKLTIKNNIMEDCYGRGIFIIESDNCRIERNVIRRIGIVPGIGIDGVNGGTGITITNRELVQKQDRQVSNNNYVGYNIIDSTGYGSIRIDGYNSVCEYNVAKYALLTLNDGGMIYCWANDSDFTHHNIIRNNMVSYNIGNTKGTPKDHGINIGVYVDNNAHHITVENNVVQGTGSGIHINDGSYNNTITGNILYGNEKAISFAEWNYERIPAVCQNNVCTNNILFNIYNMKHTLSILNTYEPKYDPATIDKNIYASPVEQYHIKLATVDDGCKFTREYTLAAWQKQSNDDANSKFIDIDKDTKHGLYTNESPQKKEIILNKAFNYTTLTGEPVNEKIILEPYSASILLYKYKTMSE